MFTKNWYAYTNEILIAQESEAPGVLTNNATPYKNATISSGYSMAAFYSIQRLSGIMAKVQRLTDSALSSYTTNGNYGVIFGDGNAEPTANDNSLSGNPVTTFNVTFVKKGEYKENSCSIEYTYSLTNTASEDITIKEIALIMPIYCLNSSNNSRYYYAVLERTLLENPVTIEPGGVGQVTYTIRMNNPTT